MTMTNFDWPEMVKYGLVAAVVFLVFARILSHGR